MAITDRSEYCKADRQRNGRSHARVTGKWIDSGGYVRVSGKHDHPNAYSDGKMLEHVFVMSGMLGRALLPGENVHHKNGVRDDNRPENLELWVSTQPSGQRPEDLLQWAKEIIERYESKETENG